MSDTYNEIINSSNIQTILEHYGLNVEKNKCLCPFHKDNHPSMSIHKNKNIVKCFACGASGNAISFIQKYENEINHNSIGIREAMQKAIDIQGLNIVIQSYKNEPLPEEKKNKQKKTNILKDVITITENNLKMNDVECSKVREYLKNRNLSDEIVKHFHIGYDFSKNNILDELLKKYNINDLISLGIAKEYNNWVYDVFSNRIIIPIFDENGNPVGFGARAINNTIKPKYLNTSANELFNKSNLLFNYHNAKYYARDDEIIVVEGYMDVISSKAMGFDNVVGTMGTALTKEHIKLFKKLNCEVTLSLDNDDAGKDAMIRVIPELLKENLKVSVLDISKIGNYKDFGDLQVANIPKEKIYQTKISAFTFLMQEKYIKDKDLTVENIDSIYKKMSRDGLIKTSKDIMKFKEVVRSKTQYSSEEIDKITKPIEVQNSTRLDTYKDVFFYHYMVDIIKNYANKHEDSILLKYINEGKLSLENLLNSIDNENYLKDGELTINIGAYIKDYIYESEEYKTFKNDKSIILDKLLNNVKSFDSKGNIVDIELTLEQKQIVINQYNNSFDSSIKNIIENSPDEFEDLFIANNYNQFEKLFPKTYVQALKEQAINRFKNDNVMEAVRYGLAYPDNMKSAMNRQFVNNEKFKTLLVFNNNKNTLGLSHKNIKENEKENIKQNEYELESTKYQVEESKYKIEDLKNNIDNTNSKNTVERNSHHNSRTNQMSVFIKLSGKERESYKGMYLPIDENTQIFVPKQLYKKDKDKIEILNSRSNQANLSEYQVDSNEHTKKWISRLSLEDFYKKYFKLYEVQMEKEVMA